MKIDEQYLNTIIVFAQKFIVAVASLFVTPVLLNRIGIDSYGLYLLAMAIVGSVSFINWALNTASQRYISVCIGKKETQSLLEVVSASICIHAFYSLLLGVALSLLYSYGLHKIFNIPQEMEYLFNRVFINVAIITCLSVLSVPFISYFRAQEQFTLVSIIALMDPLFKVLFLVLLSWFREPQFLVIFVRFLLISQILILATYIFLGWLYINNRSNFIVPVPLNVLKDLTEFLGWSIVGALVTVSRNQGVIMLLNQFFSLAVNAAYGIALQINALSNMLGQSLVSVVSPALMRKEGEGNRKSMLNIAIRLSNNGFLITSLIAMILILNAEIFLKIWLGNEIPLYAMEFIRLVLYLSTLSSLSSGIQSTFLALNKIKIYNITVGPLIMCGLPFSWFLFSRGFSPSTVIWVNIGLELVALFLRVYLLRRFIDFDSKFLVLRSILGLGAFFLFLKIGEYFLGRYCEDIYYNILITSIIVSCYIFLIKKFAKAFISRK